MGLYISAHPLDRYEIYFEEQTHPYDLITAENDGKTVVIGGIISAVRTIMTKSSTRMAFVKLENKIAEQEVIVFPSLYEEVGAKLEQDNVVRVSGRINARDKDGNITSDVKIIADSIEVVPDTILENYQSTGQKLPLPKDAPQPRRRSTSRASSVSRNLDNANNSRTKHSSPVGEEPVHRIITPPRDPRKEKLYVLIENPNDTDSLSQIRRLCERNPGVQEIILVLKDETGKRPVRLPFKVEVCEELTKPLGELLGEQCVKVQ